MKNCHHIGAIVTSQQTSDDLFLMRCKKLCKKMHWRIIIHHTVISSLSYLILKWKSNEEITFKKCNRIATESQNQ